MRIVFRKSFTKMYGKLNSKQKDQVDKAICSFEGYPFSMQLKNHKLTGTLKGCRAISAGNDLRIIFQEEKNYVIVYMLYVGTHNQVY